MKLRNKKTGLIVEFYVNNNLLKFRRLDDGNATGSMSFESLAELNEEWEDYDEPKEYWCIDWCGGVNHITVLDNADIIDSYEQDKKLIGNYFETKEEAEKAVEKLKAWKRLKDNGWKTVHYNIAVREASVIFSTGYTITEQDRKDLDLLFGGEE